MLHEESCAGHPRRAHPPEVRGGPRVRIGSRSTGSAGPGKGVDVGDNLQGHEVEGRLTRSQLLARGGAAGLALLGSDTTVRLFGGAGEALAATGPAEVRTFLTRPDLRPPATHDPPSRPRRGRGASLHRPVVRPRSARRAHLRRRGRAALVPPDARDGDGLPCPDLEGQAGADLVGGHVLARGPRPRRLRDGRRLVPRDRPDPCRRPPGRRPARVPAHPLRAPRS